MPLEPLNRGSVSRGRILAGIAVALLFVVGYFTNGFGLFGGPAPEQPDAPLFVRQGDKIVVPDNSPLRAHLTVAAAAAEPVSPKLILPGVVEADPARVAAVLPALGGRIVELKVALGDRVTKGQVLALDDDAKAKDQLALTEKNLARQQGQVKIGAASPRDLDQAASDHAQAESEYRRTQARLKAVGASGEAERGQPLLAVRAPVDGSITALSAANGAMINDPTQPMMTVADLSAVWVTALAPEGDVAFLAKDQDAEAVLAAYPGQTLHGKIKFVSDVIEPDSRRDKVRIAFDNSDYKLKPNMFATVTVVGSPRSRVVLPTSALLMNNDRTTVFVATAPWTFERRTVEPLLEEGTTVPIGAGLSAGEQVVVKGGILLND
jgi:cobalt-zinc-cadmium efflux system membrane fusion protein